MKSEHVRGHFGLMLAAGVIAALPAVSEASFANRLKKSYGGTLSTNTSTSTQQLTSDPASILKGSVSTTYNPAIVKLSEILPGPFFDVSALIGIRLANDLPTTERFVSGEAFFNGLPYSFTETGYLQVSFQRNTESPAQSIIQTRPGYIFADADGETDGDDTHALFFSALDPNSDAIASYNIYQEDGTKHDVLPDYLVNLEQEVFTTDITGATVAGVVPEPASGVLALAALGGIVLRRRR